MTTIYGSATPRATVIAYRVEDGDSVINRVVVEADDNGAWSAELEPAPGSHWEININGRVRNVIVPEVGERSIDSLVHIRPDGALLPGRYTSTNAVHVAASDANQQADFYCDGVDDEVQIQAAIEQAVDRQVPVVLSPGTFQIGAPIEIAHPVTVLGHGRDLTRLAAVPGLNAYVIKFANTNPDGTVAARFAHFQIDGRCDQQTTGGGCIDASGAVQCSFQHLHFINPFHWGLLLGPMYHGAFGHHNRVVDCLFDATLTSAGYGGGVLLTSNDENWISRCDFEFLGGLTAPAPSPTPVAVLDLAGLQKINNSVFVGGRGNATHVRLQDTKLSEVTACTFDGSAGHAIVASGSRHVIASNVITSPGDQGTVPASGIFIEFGGRGIVVSGNVLETPLAAGKCASLIRETGDGDAGGNVIVNNSLWINAAPTVGATDLSGVDSVVANNVINPA